MSSNSFFSLVKLILVRNTIFKINLKNVESSSCSELFFSFENSNFKILIIWSSAYSKRQLAIGWKMMDEEELNAGGEDMDDEMTRFETLGVVTRKAARSISETGKAIGEKLKATKDKALDSVTS